MDEPSSPARQRGPWWQRDFGRRGRAIQALSFGAVVLGYFGSNGHGGSAVVLIVLAFLCIVTAVLLFAISPRSHSQQS
jgi:hypothetical protein